MSQKPKVGEVQSVEISKLKFFEGNPKKFKSRTFGLLVKSIKEIGIQEPILVNIRTNVVVNGNQRLKAAMQLGHKEIKVLWCELTDEEEGLILAHLNGTLAERDEDAYYALLQKYQNSDFVKDLLKNYATAVKNMHKAMSPEFEIVREVDESYDYLVFISKRGIDYANLETFFNLSRVYDPHKERLIGQGRVVDADILMKLIQVASKHGIKNASEL